MPPEQRWMTFLEDQKYNIGLFDMGDKRRDSIGWFGKGEYYGLKRIKEKRRFGKNMAREGDEKKFTPEDIFKMLSFGLDKDAMMEAYNQLHPDKRQAMNRWVMMAFWRRTSKLGIELAISPLGLNSRVHFNLTSGKQIAPYKFDPVMDGIIADIQKEDIEGKGRRKITESEYRYVTRLLQKRPDLYEKILRYNEFAD